MEAKNTYSNAETVSAWADITLKIWREKITDLKIWDTGALYRSLKYTFDLHAGNNIEKIEFSFNFYGLFIDKGTQFIEQREWYSKVYYAQVMRLKEILIEKFGKEVVSEIVFAMQ